MHPNTKDLTGQRFGRLVATKPTTKRSGGHVIWECRCDCGVLTTVTSTNLIRGQTQSCGCRQRDISSRVNKENHGSKNSQWKGGRRVRSDGYILIYAPTHPAAGVRKAVSEHRLIMEQKLGRYLQPEEIVHHIDGDPANNAPENLDLFADTGKHTAYHRKLELIAEET